MEVIEENTALNDAIEEEDSSFDIVINEDMNTNDIFLNLRSESLKKQSKNDLELLLSNDKIILHINNEWYASEHAYVHLQDDNKKNIQNIIKMLKKQKNVYWYVYLKRKIYNMCIINTNLALDYYEQLNKYCIEKLNVSSANIYITINKNIEQSIATNDTKINMKEYFRANDLYEQEIEKEINKEYVEHDVEMLLPTDISLVIDKIKTQHQQIQNIVASKDMSDISNNLFSKEEIDKFDKFKEKYLKIILEKNDQNVQIKLIVKYQLNGVNIELDDDEIQELFKVYESLKMNSIMNN